MGKVNIHRVIFFRVFACGLVSIDGTCAGGGERERESERERENTCEIKPNHFTAYVCLSVTAEESPIAFS
jgi:hypothetical protein